MILPSDKYIIVNYHYVENPHPDWKGIHPCPIGEFERQMKFLSQNFKITSIPEVLQASKQGLPDRYCALTFDDCMKDVFINALPILQKYGLKATFFPITATLEGFFPYAHRVHILLSKVPADKIIDYFNSFFIGEYPNLKNKYRIPKDRRIEQKRAYDDVPAANLKETLIMMPVTMREKFIKLCLEKFDLEEIILNKNFFMDKEDIKNLRQMGMFFGCHSHTHNSFEEMDEKLISEDIALSKKILEDLIGKDVEIFSFSHGRWTEGCLELLQKHGFHYAVTIEKRGLARQDSPFLIPRYDANSVRDYLNSKEDNG